MRGLALSGSTGGPPRRILLLGAHCDDIEIGCGGTVLRLVRDYPQAFFHWVVFSSNATRAAEARTAAAALLGKAAHEIAIKEFRNGYFPYIGAEIKDYFEELKRAPAPDLIFTHYRNDLHQDHRIVSELTWNTFRDHLILEYEIPKYDGDLGSPSAYIALDTETAARKADVIVESFVSEGDKHWFTRDTFLALARLRGIECAAPGGYAEAFYARKMTIA
ncbi:MAG TPA: PIG-L family deacetylase [Acidiferrobacterales bacterium]|jgi:LmbE family N-acetylglucosaminyl deacetylase